MISISKSFALEINNFDASKGITALMYHRFEENKYPSTNIKNEIFIKHIDEIKKSGIEFISYKKFEEIINNKIEKKYVLLTIDDGYESFYLNAWPILEEKNIPFILFISTREVGKRGYMNWKQIKELDSNHLVTIGNHSHSHDYLIDWAEKEIKNDIEISINIFKKKLGHSPVIFSYPFGEYSNNLKNIVDNLNFKFAFGQHSGVIDTTKDFLTLPRFPINEKYGNLKRFNSILEMLPFPYKKIIPDDRYLKNEQNPPEVKIEFFENLIDIKNINCYSNEGGIWKKSEVKFLNNFEIIILLKEKFNTERGRINCSVHEKNNKWRWLGLQYVIAEF